MRISDGYFLLALVGMAAALPLRWLLLGLFEGLPVLGLWD